MGTASDGSGSVPLRRLRSVRPTDGSPTRTEHADQALERLGQAAEAAAAAGERDLADAQRVGLRW